MGENYLEKPTVGSMVSLITDDTIMIDDINVLENTIFLSPVQRNQVDVPIESSDEKVEPLKVGMKFEKWEDIEVHYKKYAKQQGFGICRPSSSFRANKERRAVTWRCDCWGQPNTQSTRDDKQVDKQMEIGGGLSQKLVTKKSKKCNCPAMVYASLDSDNLWEVTKVINEHENHFPSPSKSKHIKQHREDHFTNSMKRRVMSNYDAGIRPAKSFACFAEEYGGWDNVPITQKDVYKHVSEVKRLKMADGDAKAMNEYFEKMQAHNQNFFYAYRCNENGSLTDVIWVDARSRVAYEEFGDVVCFDTTYLTNNYDLPFANFVGVNHHGQSLLLGCALISHENCETFEWLFRQWLLCMGGKAPRAILTDQAAAMRRPLIEVMPYTKHRWCIWHIMQKFGRKLGNYASYEKLKEDLKQAIYNSLTVEEFENGWKSAIKDNKVESNEWLQYLFNESLMWAPVHMRDIFWAGMMTTQRVESINSFFDGFVNSKTRLYEFVARYCSAMGKRVEDEKAADALSAMRHSSLSTGYVVEKIFREIYTNAKFREVQVQCERVTYCNSKEVKMISAIEVLHVIEDRVWVVPKGSSKEVVTQYKRLYRITYNHNTIAMDCECRLFVTHGIMCRHMIRLLDWYNVPTVPDMYILNRWRRDITRKHTRVRVPYHDPHDTIEGQRHHKMRLAFEPICDDAEDGDDTVDIVISMLNEMHLKVKEAKEKRPHASKIDSRMKDQSVNSFAKANTLVFGATSSFPEVHSSPIEFEVTHMKDPSSVRKRGRPKTTRIQGAHEKETKNNKGAKSRKKGNEISQDTMTSNLATSCGDIHIQGQTQASHHPSSIVSTSSIVDLNIPGDYNSASNVAFGQSEFIDHQAQALPENLHLNMPSYPAEPVNHSSSFDFFSIM